MATITVQAEGNKDLHPCKDRNPPVRTGSSVEFRDATEEELAFWNVLDEDEKRGVAMEASRRCFYDALHEYMQSEARKGKKLEDQESAAIGRPKADIPPDSPPTPSGPNQPPILDGGS